MDADEFGFLFVVALCFIVVFILGMANGFSTGRENTLNAFCESKNMSLVTVDDHYVCIGESTNFVIDWMDN